MDINAIWQIMEPWLNTILTALGTALAIYATIKVYLKKWNFSLMERYDPREIASSVAEKLSGKMLNIDVTAVTEKKLDKIEQKLNKRVETICETIAAYSHILARIGAAVAKFKSLTDEERQELQEAVKALDKGYIPPEPEEIITVKLEPIAIDTPAEDAESESVINFGGVR